MVRRHPHVFSDATADSRKPCPCSGTTSSERSKTGIRPR
jgi:hypothetical protein